jgi:flavin-dependent dehydrogenase
VETEICVVGGGPAGSTIARQLALLGHQVCLVEKARFPRDHIGESLPPSILRVLDLVGVRAPIEAAGFSRPRQSLIRWSSPAVIETALAGELGFQVDRGRFDQILLAATQADGVQVLQPAQAARPVSLGHQQWRVPVRWRGELLDIRARFLVNATGRQRAFSRTKPRPPTTLAIYGYWRGTAFQGCASRVEAGRNVWFWGAPLPDGRFNAAVFVDATRYVATKPRDREQWYRTRLAQTTLFKDCLGGDLTAPIQICNASAGRVETAIGDDWIQVGDAALALDPLSSQGVQMAMMSAFQGAIAVHTLLTEPTQAAAAIAFYDQKLQDTLTRSQHTAAQVYATQAAHPPTPFWQQRSQVAAVAAVAAPPWEQNTAGLAIDSPIRLSAAVSLRPTAVIQGKTIRWVNALHHPALAQPIAYLGDIAIAPLLTQLVAGQTVWDLMQHWSTQHHQSTIWQLLQWLWSQHMIVLDTPNRTAKAI